MMVDGGTGYDVSNMAMLLSRLITTGCDTVTPVTSVIRTIWKTSSRSLLQKLKFRTDYYLVSQRSHMSQEIRGGGVGDLLKWNADITGER